MEEITEFGKKVRIALIEQGKSCGWLISEVTARTGMYFDRSYYSKIMRGKNSNAAIIAAIQDILNL